MTATEAREQANKLGVDMRSLLDKCKDEKREMTADEETTFDKMDADREKLLAAERRQIRIDELDAPAGRRTEPRQPGDVRTGRISDGDVDRLSDEHNDGLRAWFSAQMGIPLTKAQEAIVKRQGVNLQSRTINLRRPKSVLRSLSAVDEQRWEKQTHAMLRSREELRAMSTLTTTSPEDGSYLIANEAMAPLERAMLAYGNVRAVSTVIRTATGAAMPFPTSDDTSNKGVLLAENTQTVKKDVEVGTVTLNAFKFSSKEVLISRELFQDAQTDMGAFMFSALGERLARIMNQYATTGTGSSEPKGVVACASDSAIALAAKTPTYAELVSIEGALDPAYRNGASWMFHDTVLQEIKKIVETTTGRPIWLPNMAGGAPDTILSYPYSINQDMAVAASTGSGKSILFGQMKKFLYREVQDIEIMRLNELYAEYYQVAFLGFARMDSDLLDAGTHPVKYASNHS